MLTRIAATGVRLCSGWTVRETVARLTCEFEAADVPEPQTSANHIVANLMSEDNIENLLGSQGRHFPRALLPQFNHGNIFDL